MATSKKTPQVETPADPQHDSASVQGDVESVQKEATLRYRIAARNQNGFWRCGRKWHPDGVVLTLDEIGGHGVLATLQDEPMLIVQQVGAEQ